MTIKTQSEKPTPEKVVKHTAGPWKYEAIPAEAYTDPDLAIAPESRFWIVDDHVAGEVLALVEAIGLDGHAEANAALIAAAPELLEALKGIVQDLRDHIDGGAESKRMDTWLTSLIGIAEAALSKAGGQL